MRAQTGRHRHRQRRARTGLMVTLGVVVAAGITTAAVATPLLDDSVDLTAEVSGTTATRTATPTPTADPSSGASTRGDESVTRSAERSTAADVVPATPIAQRVVRAAKVKRKPARVLRQERLAAERAAAALNPVTLRIGSFNVLGSQHSRNGGDRPNWPSSSWRTPQTAALIARHGVDVVGLQEVQEDQLNGLTRATGFAAYPGYALGAKETDNSILYDTAKFEFVSGSHFTITFMGRPRPQTILLLRERSTGREMYFVNMHASAHGGANAVTRAAGHNTAVGVVNDLRATGLPVFLTGDMNDRAPFFCRVLPPTGMVAAVGGNISGGCHPPGRMQVDWIVASNDVGFSGYTVDGSPQARKISDHFFISATATIAPAS